MDRRPWPLVLCSVVCTPVHSCCVSDVPGLSDVSSVERFRAEVSSALLDYCSLMSLTLSSDDSQLVVDKFGRMLLELSEIKLASIELEEFLYQQHVAGCTSTGSLLAEMLLSSRQ